MSAPLDMSSILVTGATGFIGLHLVEELLRRGERVRCLIRPTSNVQMLQRLGVELVVANLEEPECLRRHSRNRRRLSRGGNHPGLSMGGILSGQRAGYGAARRSLRNATQSAAPRPYFVDRGGRPCPARPNSDRVRPARSNFALWPQQAGGGTGGG